MRLFLISIFSFLCGTLFSQSYRLSNAIPVQNLNGTALEHPWAGGMNNPQFSSVDLNLDGHEELIYFDRSDYTFTVFENGGKSNQSDYRYSPKLLASLDSCQCTEWALFRDYNCDGLEDLFCGRGSGSNFRVYEQVIYDNDSVGFEMRYDPIFSQGSTYSWMYVVRTDVPAIVDIDWDGDMDIVSSTNGYNFFILHRNMAMDSLGRCDTLVYYSEFGCWGEFAESNVDNTLLTGDSTNCPRGGGGESGEGGSSRHVGSSLLVFDTNADSLYDVLVGDVSSASMVAAYNYGTVPYAQMDSVEPNYPQLNVPIDMELFPAAFYEDIDNDGVRDLLVAPNSTIDVKENVRGVVLYKNVGLDNDVNFQYAGRNFLVEDHIDAGENSGPFFLDYNHDGLMDLLVAGSFSNIRVGDSIYERNLSYLYENIGTPAEPIFQIVDSNYLDFDQLPVPIREPSVGGGDLDGDGDMDLLIGVSPGTIYHFINTAAFGLPATYSLAPTPLLEDVTGFPIDIGGASAPELYDWDADGDLDLFVGERFGRIWYYENIGTPTMPSFSLVTQTFGQVKVSNDYESQYSGYAHPRFLDYDRDGTIELLVGSERGYIEVFENIALAMSDSLEGDPFLIDFGNLVNPTAAILDTSDRYTYVTGNPRGGVMLYAWTAAAEPDTMPEDTTVGFPPIAENDIKVYPNPTDSELWIEMPSDSDSYQIRLYNMVGQALKAEQALEPKHRMDLSGLSAGIYLLEVLRGRERHTAKVWVQ